MTKRMISSIDELPCVKQYLMRIGAEVRSMRTAVVKESHGKYWRDLAVIRFSRAGDVVAVEDYGPTEEETKKIKEEFTDVEFPRLMTMVAPLRHPMLPDAVKQADREDVFEFHDGENRVVMLQVRMIIGDTRHYVPFTFWSDEKWRQMEPEGPLPLWGPTSYASILRYLFTRAQKPPVPCAAWWLGARLPQRSSWPRTPGGKSFATPHTWAGLAAP